MIKKLKYILIIFPIILSILLIINISKYQKTKTKLNNLNTNISTYQNKINEINTKEQTLSNELNKLNEQNNDKILEYHKWIQWKKEILSKIN